MRDFEGRTVLFGGTFNPVHYGHLRAAEEVRERFLLQRVMFIPSCNPPLKSADLAPSSDRMRMVEIATVDNPSFDLSGIECEREGRSYTVDTIEEFIRSSGERPVFLLGADSFLDIPKWHRHERLLELTDFIVVSRPGYPLEKIRAFPWIDAVEEGDGGDALIRISSGGSRGVSLFVCIPGMEISASDIRRRVREGRSIRYLLPEGVERYIRERRLYL